MTHMQRKNNTKNKDDKETRTYNKRSSNLHYINNISMFESHIRINNNIVESLQYLSNLLNTEVTLKSIIYNKWTQQPPAGKKRHHCINGPSCRQLTCGFLHSPDTLTFKLLQYIFLNNIHVKEYAMEHGITMNVSNNGKRYFNITMDQLNHNLANIQNLQRGGAENFDQNSRSCMIDPQCNRGGFCSNLVEGCVGCINPHTLETIFCSLLLRDTGVPSEKPVFKNVNNSDISNNSNNSNNPNNPNNPNNSNNRNNRNLKYNKKIF